MKLSRRIGWAVLAVLLFTTAVVGAASLAPTLCSRIGLLDDGRILWAGDCTDLPTVTATPTIRLTATKAPTNTPPPPVVTSTGTPKPATPTVTQTPTVAPTVTPTLTPTVTVGPTLTAVPPTAVPTGTIAPFASAPLCVAHNNSTFHTLWNSALGCHYNHEHGQNPFTAEADALFAPLGDLRTSLGGVEIGHTNPSSPVENTDKHGGEKWNTQFANPEGCAGFEGATTGTSGSLVQYHGFGNYAIEAEARFHSAYFRIRQCRTSNPNDFGYIESVVLNDFGQRITPYQGTIVPFPNQPSPSFESRAGPYLSFDCVGNVIQCRSSLDFVRSRNLNTNSNWAAGVSFPGYSEGSALFRPLWRVNDTYRLFDWNDQVYPFTWLWVCSTDGGQTYNPVGCKYNNTTTQVNEIEGEIPASWDNLAGWDTDPQAGRVTINGFVDQHGNPTAVCEVPGITCYPLKTFRAFTGTYGSVLVYTEGKGPNIQPFRDGDIYFCGQVACDKTAPGAVPSGWVGEGN